MEFVKIEAWPRNERGKGPNARLRREDKVPAVAYGKGKTTLALTISPKALIEALQGPYGRNVVMEIAVGGEAPFPALIRDYSYHPLTRKLEHVDFLQIDLEKPVQVEVPLTTTGKPVGVVAGGALRQIFRTLPIECLARDVPEKLVHDVTSLELGHAAKTSDLVLPAGVRVRLPAEQTIIAVVAPEKQGPEEGAAAAAGAEAAAPAAAAKAAPAKAEAPAKAAK